MRSPGRSRTPAVGSVSGTSCVVRGAGPAAAGPPALRSGDEGGGVFAVDISEVAFCDAICPGWVDASSKRAPAAMLGSLDKVYAEIDSFHSP